MIARPRIQKFVRTARRYRTTEIQIGPHTITAANSCRGPAPRHRNDRSGR
jgi:hypothetical protein